MAIDPVPVCALRGPFQLPDVFVNHSLVVKASGDVDDEGSLTHGLVQHCAQPRGVVLSIDAYSDRIRMDPVVEPLGMVLEDLPEVWTTQDLWVSRIDLIDRRVHGRSTPLDHGVGTPQNVRDDRDQPARHYLLDHRVEVHEHRGLRHTPVQRGVRPVVQGDILPREEVQPRTEVCQAIGRRDVLNPSVLFHGQASRSLPSDELRDRHHAVEGKMQRRSLGDAVPQEEEVPREWRVGVQRVHIKVQHRARSTERCANAHAQPMPSGHVDEVLARMIGVSRHAYDLRPTCDRELAVVPLRVDL
jgi:hypothetical protein